MFRKQFKILSARLENIVTKYLLHSAAEIPQAIPDESKSSRRVARETFEERDEEEGMNWKGIHWMKDANPSIEDYFPTIRCACSSIYIFFVPLDHFVQLFVYHPMYLLKVVLKMRICNEREALQKANNIIPLIKIVYCMIRRMRTCFGQNSSHLRTWNASLSLTRCAC